MKKKHRIKKWIRLFCSYLILNAGILGWIEVTVSSDNRLHSQQIPAAVVSVQPDQPHIWQISVLNQPVLLDNRFLHSLPAKTVLLTCSDPAAIALISALSLW